MLEILKSRRLLAIQLVQNRKKIVVQTYPTGRVTIQDTMKIITCLICVHGQEGYILGREDWNRQEWA